MPQNNKLQSNKIDPEICPVCNTVQSTYRVPNHPNDRYMVEHDHDDGTCKGSHTTRG